MDMNIVRHVRSLRTLLPMLLAVVPVAGMDADPTPVFRLTSPAYVNGGAMSTRFTCAGSNISPPLAWSGAPAGTKSFVLIIDDPDAPDPAAPQTTWVHWVLYDIPASVDSLPPGAATHLPADTRTGSNDWQRAVYGGPCPPIGRHRYVHKLYALDVVLPDLHAPTKAVLEAVMHGHILAEAELVGTYQKRADQGG